jgi:hypothetical protein
MTDRRSFITAALMAPVAIAAPASAIAHDGGFRQAVAKFRQMRAIYDNHPGHDVMASHPDYREQADAVTAMCREVSRQFDAVMRIPAPDVGAIATKLELALEEYQDFEMPNEAIAAIARDAKRLAA